MGYQKTVSKAVYGLTGLAMKPIYKMMREETKAFQKEWDRKLNMWSQDYEAEQRHRTFQVHQMNDPIVNHKSIW